MGVTYSAINHFKKQTFAPPGQFGDKRSSLSAPNSPFSGMFLMKFLEDNRWEIIGDECFYGLEDNHEYKCITNEVFSAYNDIYNFEDKYMLLRKNYFPRIIQIIETCNSIEIHMSGKNKKYSISININSERDIDIRSIEITEI